MEIKEQRELLEQKLAQFTPTSVYGHFGLETNYGWDQLLIDTLDKVKVVLDKHWLKLTNFQIAQIKEKFGTLRFYWSVAIDEEISMVDRECIYNELDKIISLAEKQSGKICEKCSKPGKECNPRSWLFTLCKECEQKVKENYKEGWVP